MHPIDKFSEKINTCVEYLLFGIGFSMAIIVAIQVFSRYVLNHSLFWSEEVARYLLVWLAFLGASVAYRRRVHPGIDTLHNKMPFRIRKGVSILVILISISFFMIMIIYGYQFANFVKMQISPSLEIPIWIIFSVIPISGLILTIHGIAQLVRELTETNNDG